MARRLEASAPQHGRPEDRVEPGDVLADDVQVGRPPAGERLRVIGEAGAGDVVDERVVPDVDDARLRIPRAVLALRGLAVLGDRERDPPVAGVRSRQIEKSSRPPRMKPSISLRRYSGWTKSGCVREVRARAVPGRPTGGRTSSSRSATGAARRGGSGRSSAAVSDVGRVAEALVRAVPALVRAEIDVAVGVGPADHLLGRADVVRVGRPDEPVGGDASASSATLNSRPSRRRSRGVGDPRRPHPGRC